MPKLRAILHVAKTQQASDVQLELTNTGVQVENANKFGEFYHIDDLELVPVGYADTQSILKVKSTGDTLIGPDMKLLKALASTAKGDLQAQIQTRLQQHKRETNSLTASWSAITLALACLIVLTLSGTNIVVDLAMAQIPPTVEGQLGQYLFDSYASSHKLLTNSDQERRIAKLGDSLVRHLPRHDYNFHFHVEKSPNLNAFAMPGGNIVVYSEVLNQAQSDDELADILAHEIGHVFKRHSLRAALHEAGMWTCLQLVFKGHGQVVHAALKQWLNMDKLSFSRSQEEQADKIGVKLAFVSGYDPNGLITFFERLKKQEFLGDNKFLAMLSTHPMTTEREQYIQKEIAALKRQPRPPSPDELEVGTQ